MVVAYIKISDFCNIGCSHCYLPKKVRENKTVMNVTVLHKVIADLKQLCEVRRSQELNIVWHGGEPLLVDSNLYIKYMGVIKDAFVDSGVRVSFSIQTSLIPLNKKWIEVIKKHFNSSIGISVDFSARTIGGTKDRYMSVLEKRLGMCRDNDIAVAANVVVSKSELGRADCLINWFVERGIMEVEFSRFNAYMTDFSEQPTNREHSIFLSDVIDSLIDRVKKGELCPIVPSIDAAVQVAIGGVSNGTWGGGCLFGNYVVNPDGKTSNCPDRISFDATFNNNEPFVESISRAKTFVDYGLRVQSTSCSDCDYRAACKGGCPIEKNNVLENGDCSGFKTLLDYICRLYATNGVAKMCMDMVLGRE